MVVIANDWTTRIVWAQLDTLLRGPPFWDGPEPPSQALIKQRPGMSFIHFIPATRPSPMDGSVRRYGLTAFGLYYLKALENPDAAHGEYLRIALKHPEIESAEALAIYNEVSTRKKLLGWLSVVGVQVALRKQWLRHKLGGLGEHIVYIAIAEGVCFALTGHEIAWWIGKAIEHLKSK
jgi:hypothetical protein